jgi:hypothetical protein
MAASSTAPCFLCLDRSPAGPQSCKSHCVVVSVSIERLIKLGVLVFISCLIPRVCTCRQIYTAPIQGVYTSHKMMHIMRNVTCSTGMSLRTE